MATSSKVVLLVLLMSSAALADDAGILRCRGITEPAARLACYDGLVLGVGSAPSVRPAEQFGRESQQIAASVPVLQSIQSHIPGVFEGWQPNSRIRLANGQVWQVTDGSSGSYRLVDPKVNVERGALGSFFLELLGEKRSMRVRRIE